LDAYSVKENFIKFLDVLAMHFSNSWFRLNLQEQKILTTLLDESLNRSGIAKKLNVTSGAIGRSLNRLLDNGLIEMGNNKYYAELCF